MSHRLSWGRGKEEEAAEHQAGASRGARAGGRREGTPRWERSWRGDADGGSVDPAEPSPEGRGDRAVGATGDFEAQEHVVNEVGEELDGSQELMIGAKARVELRALVVHQAVGAVGQPAE